MTTISLLFFYTSVHKLTHNFFFFSFVTAIDWNISENLISTKLSTQTKKQKLEHTLENSLSKEEDLEALVKIVSYCNKIELDLKVGHNLSLIHI